MRWSKGYARVAELAAPMPETRLVYVADREADIRELMGRVREIAPAGVKPIEWRLLTNRRAETLEAVV